MPLTDRLSVFAGWVFDLLNDETFKTQESIVNVIYGDVERIGGTPTVCVEPSEKRRDYNGAPRRTSVALECYVIIYYGTIQSSQENRKEVDSIAEDIEARLHADPTCGSLVIDSHVSRLESGVANKGGTFHRATRLVFTARSQVQLPMAPGA
jgi:hypothetical protein